MILTTKTRLGVHVWTDTAVRGEIDDSLRVLTGLSFGWKMSGDLWPVQPDPMTATLSVNVPDFVDAADISKGEVAAVEVYMHDDDWIGGDLVPVASFYGRITDVKAKPRGGSRPGVTDGTADLDDFAVLSDLWYAVCGDTLVGTGLWWFGFETGVAIWPATGLVNPKAVIDQILLEHVSPATDQRMIISPLIPYQLTDTDAGGEPPSSGRQFTLDILTKPDMDSGTVDDTFAANVVQRDIEWAQIKGDAPTAVTVTGYQSAGVTTTTGVTVYAPGVIAPFFQHAQALTVDLEDDGTLATQLGGFYLGDPATDDTWQIDTVTIAAQLYGRPGYPAPSAFTRYLFPHWEADERDAARAACYARRVAITGIRSDLCPYGATTVRGVLMGAQIQLNNGKPTIALTLRRMRHT